MSAHSMAIVEVRCDAIRVGETSTLTVAQAAAMTRELQNA